MKIIELEPIDRPKPEPEPEREQEKRPSFTRSRGWSIGFHVVLSSWALLALVVMLNYLAHKHDRRFRLGGASSKRLTPLTEQVLDGLTNRVKVTVFFDRREPLFGAVSEMIKEYQARSPRLEVEFVDYQLPGRSGAVRAQYGLAAEGDSSRVIFDAGGVVRTVLSTELSDFAMAPDQEIRRTGFRGERLFTSALLNVAQAGTTTAFFTQGHGEHRLDEGDQGYGRFARLLENNNVQPRELAPLLGTNGIPEACGLLIIAGPTRLFENEEIRKIEEYLARGGRLLALFNINARLTPTGLEQMLLRWNVQVGFDWIQDTTQAQAGDSAVILTSNFGAHPIVRSLLRSSVTLVAPRSVSHRPAQQSAADEAKITEVLFSSSTGRQLVPVDEERWRVNRDGALPLLVAGERGAIQGVKTEKNATRLVVGGDSLFLSNVVFSHAANSDLGNLIVNWLINRDSVLNEIGPSPVSEYRILLTETQMRGLRWMLLAVLPGLVTMVGLVVWWRRRV